MHGRIRAHTTYGAHMHTLTPVHTIRTELATTPDGSVVKLMLAPIVPKIRGSPTLHYGCVIGVVFMITLQIGLERSAQSVLQRVCHLLVP